MKKATRCLLFLVMASCTLLFAFAPRFQLLEGGKQELHVRALLPDQSSSPAASSSTPASASSAPASQTSSSQATSSTTPASSSQPSSTPPPSSSPPSNTATNPSSTNPAGGDSSIATTATNADGQVFTSVVAAPAPSSAAPTTTSSSSGGSGSSGLGTGSIVGLSVAGGVAVIGILSFFVWKFTRKRFSDFDDNEAIKWPELNTHGGGDVHALPTKSTGRSGFGTENDSDINLARAPSPSVTGGYAHSVAASSVPDVYGSGQDPYAVPPLPHLNPNQPYRDDPGTYGQPGYYDPYRGPVPNTFGDGFSDGHGAEAIPMTQMARTRSPGPQAAYDMQGRGSPGPQAALGYGVPMEGRTGSPAPSALGARRPSPGPQGAYGYGQR
ncbi:hypothetical protein BV22DRAFT_1064233 [Leucogyrophana mollusca]|uniref:Uncharacterized protein n=1 Tax=Leucogyrophana mollusca TaxID=85980 RepID=A0ACB8BJ08_9AGAM|nr:hypothetical protein BV22DRAFT_1064233 [Leucogyrophana mollusca]